MAPASSPARSPRSLMWVGANALEIGTAAMLVAICVIVFVNVFFRYFLHIGLGWTEELARYLQVWMTFLGATVAVKRWAHFQLTIVDQLIPSALRRFTRLFAILVVMTLAGIMIKNGIEITRVTWNQTSPVLAMADRLPLPDGARVRGPDGALRPSAPGAGHTRRAGWAFRRGAWDGSGGCGMRSRPT